MMRGYSVKVPFFGPGIPMVLTLAWIIVGLRALTRMNMLYLRRFPGTPRMYESGVLYEREPPGQEDWQTIPAALNSLRADCEDLACWRAAELRVRDGIAARPAVRVKRLSGRGYLVHVVVKHPDGSIEDPSMRLGMGEF